MFEAVFPMLNPFAHIPVCGLISMYNATTALSSGPILLPHMMRAILNQAADVSRFHRQGALKRKDPEARVFLRRRACGSVVSGCPSLPARRD